MRRAGSDPALNTVSKVGEISYGIIALLSLTVYVTGISLDDVSRRRCLRHRLRRRRVESFLTLTRVARPAFAGVIVSVELMRSWKLCVKFDVVILVPVCRVCT